MAARRITTTGAGNVREFDGSGPEMRVETAVFKDYIKQKFKSMITSINPDNIESKLLIMDRSFSIFSVFCSPRTRLASGKLHS